MSRASVFMVFALCTALAGCEEKKGTPHPEPTGTAAAPKPTTGGPGAGGPGAITPTPASTPILGVRDEDIPVQADFEEVAEREIVPGNMDAELTKIEKELAVEIPTEGVAIPGGAGTHGAHPGKPR